MAALLGVASGAGYAQRLEVRPVETVTLSAQQVLIGDKSGKPASVSGELRIPKGGTDRLPAVILVHGASGILPALVDLWVPTINSLGIATFVIDVYSGRDIHNNPAEQASLSSLAMMVDAYNTLAMLAKHDRIDPQRVAIMGFSKGSVAALYSSNERFRKAYAPADLEFAAHIGMYSVCNTTYRDDDKVTGKPIRLFHGIADDWVPVEPCRQYVARLKNASADVVLTEYPDATHGYDLTSLKKEPIKLQATTSRNCTLAEGDGGMILNVATNQPFKGADDPCMEKGVAIAYNEAATIATVTAVKEFLLATLKP
jgi:dienelactone hydrolase